MSNIRHYLNGKQIQEPRNWRDLQIVMDFLGKQENATINIDDLQFAGDSAIDIINRINSGLNGGVGVFEGEPYKIEIGPVGNPAFVFDGFLDFTNTTQIIGCNEVSCGLQKELGQDWLNDVADGFSFRYLEDIGIITKNDFAGVPYVINYIPDGTQLLILAISTYMMTKELIEAIKDIQNRIADVTDASTPVIGVGAGFGAVAVTAWDIGNFILAILKLAISIAYAVAIVYAIIKLIEQIIEQLAPPKRFHLGMPLRLLFQRSCDYLGLKLSSTLLDAVDKSNNKWIVIPSKDHRGGERPTGADKTWVESGVPKQNDSIDTFGDLIRVFKEVFNADFRISNGVFQFERRDFWDATSTFVMPDVFNNQDKLVNQIVYNTDEFVANYNINWRFDNQDLNTLDNQTGRVFQAITEPKTIQNKNLVMMKGLEEIQIPFSLGVRKNELTTIEKILKGLVSIADALTGQLGKPQSFSGKIQNRIGSLNISSHFLTIPKIVVMNGSKLALNQRDLLGAVTLWEDYHFINSFAQYKGKHNQYIRFLDVKIPFCLENFVNLLDNNKITNKDGEVGEIEKITWNVFDDFAVVDIGLTANIRTI